MSEQSKQIHIKGSLSIDEVVLATKCPHCSGTHAVVLGINSSGPRGEFTLRLPYPLLSDPVPDSCSSKALPKTKGRKSDHG